MYHAHHQNTRCSLIILLILVSPEWNDSLVSCLTTFSSVRQRSTAVNLSPKVDIWKGNFVNDVFLASNSRLQASSSKKSSSVELPSFLEDHNVNASDDTALPSELLSLPSHSNEGVNSILEKAEKVLTALHRHSKMISAHKTLEAKEAGLNHELIFANNYVDLGKIDTVGFDYDYTVRSIQC